MRRSAWTLSAAALVLTACGGEDATAPDPSRTSDPRAFAAPEVAGPERRILAFGDSLFAGYGVSERESYPAQLEAALRGRG